MARAAEKMDFHERYSDLVANLANLVTLAAAAERLGANVLACLEAAEFRT
jgi:hypothetical protein